MLNLIINAVEAMSGVEDGDRNLLIETTRDNSGGVMVQVRDSGVGIAKEDLDHIFDARGDGNGVVDLPNHNRDARRQAVGYVKRRSRRDTSIHVAGLN